MLTVPGILILRFLLILIPSLSFLFRLDLALLVVNWKIDFSVVDRGNIFDDTLES